MRPVEAVQIGVKYEGTNEMLGLFPKNQYGGVVTWELVNDTTLSAEYLHGAYDDENRDENGHVQEERDLITLQLGVGF